MRGNRVLASLLSSLFLSFALSACWPPHPLPPGPAPIAVDIGADCTVTQPLDVTPGDQVKFCYSGDCEHVSIVFSSAEVFGRESLRVNQGTCAVLTVMSNTEDETFGLEVQCSCDPGPGTTPEIKVGDKEP